MCCTISSLSPARSLRPEKREKFEEDFDGNGIGGLNGIYRKNVERIQELPEYPL